MPDLPDPGCDPDAAAPSPADLRSLRLLRGLVTVLTATMIAGIVALVGLLYLRLPGPATPPATPPALPEGLALPEGTRAQAVTAGPGWWAVVTQDGDILVYDAGGALVRRIAAAELAGQ